MLLTPQSSPLVLNLTLVDWPTWVKELLTALIGICDLNTGESWWWIVIQWNLLSSERPSKLYMIHVCCRTRATPWDLTSSESMWIYVNLVRKLWTAEPSFLHHCYTVRTPEPFPLRLLSWNRMGGSNDRDRKSWRVMDHIVAVVAAKHLQWFDDIQTQWFQLIPVLSSSLACW